MRDTSAAVDTWEDNKGHQQPSDIHLPIAGIDKEKVLTGGIGMQEVTCVTSNWRQCLVLYNSEGGGSCGGRQWRPALAEQNVRNFG